MPFESSLWGTCKSKIKEHVFYFRSVLWDFKAGGSYRKGYEDHYFLPLMALFFWC